MKKTDLQIHFFPHQFLKLHFLNRKIQFVAHQNQKYIHIHPNHYQNNGTDDTSPTFKAFEEGAETLSKEQNSILAGRQEKFVRDLKHALIRIQNKTYGICRVTGKLIPKERLRAVPHATLSIEAKNMQR